MRTFVTSLPLGGRGSRQLSAEYGCRCYGRSYYLLSIAVPSLAEINLPGSCAHCGWKWESQFQFTRQESCMGEVGGGSLGRENLNSSAWPLSWVMLRWAGNSAGTGPGGEKLSETAVCPSAACSRSDLKGCLWRREKEDKFRGCFLSFPVLW